MNYRHDFHAGNFADVFKHIFLTRILLYLKLKPAAFRYIDTHAGSGSYDLAGLKSARTNEWRDGIGRLLEHVPSDEASALMEPYLALVRPYFKGLLYPGSPLIARDLLRDQDKLLLCEVQTDAFQRLKKLFPQQKAAKLIQIDAYIALNAFIPPVERRGLILIDPPFEQLNEFEILTRAIQRAWGKWPDGIFMIWYPVKDISKVESFLTCLKALNINRMMRLEIKTRPVLANMPLSQCGLLIINPPYSLEAEARKFLPALSKALSSGAEEDFLIEWPKGK